MAVIYIERRYNNRPKLVVLIVLLCLHTIHSNQFYPSFFFDKKLWPNHDSNFFVNIITISTNDHCFTISLLFFRAESVRRVVLLCLSHCLSNLADNIILIP